MKDPFPLEPVPWLSHLVQPWADFFSLPSLPLHFHEILASCALYSLLYWPISPWLSSIVVGEAYRKLPRKRQINWHAHVVSLFQSCLITGLALWVAVKDTDRSQMDWEARVWGYTGACGMIQALAAGYFLWDLVVTSRNMDVFGIGTLAHAVSALLVYFLGFRPFVNYYAPTFILWELSTPFLNIHWFFDKLGMTGTKAQLYNGILLLCTFFSCRLVYGSFQSVMVFKDILSALATNPNISTPLAHASITQSPEVLSFASSTPYVPLWLAAIYLVSNLTLNGLNLYWFVMMIRAVRKRFQTKRPLTTSDKVTGQALSHTGFQGPDSLGQSRRRDQGMS